MIPIFPSHPSFASHQFSCVTGTSTDFEGGTLGTPKIPARQLENGTDGGDGNLKMNTKKRPKNAAISIVFKVYYG